MLLEQMRQSPATILQPFSLDPFPVYKEPCMVVLGRRDQCQPARQSCLSSGTSLDGRRWWLNKEECDWGYCDVLLLVSSPSDLDCSQYVFYFVPLTVLTDYICPYRLVNVTQSSHDITINNEWHGEKRNTSCRACHRWAWLGGR